MLRKIGRAFELADVLLIDFCIARFIPCMLSVVFFYASLVAFTNANWPGMFVSWAVVFIAILWFKKAKIVARILHSLLDRKYAFWE